MLSNTRSRYLREVQACACNWVDSPKTINEIIIILPVITVLKSNEIEQNVRRGSK